MYGLSTLTSYRLLASSLFCIRFANFSRSFSVSVPCRLSSFLFESYLCSSNQIQCEHYRHMSLQSHSYINEQCVCVCEVKTQAKKPTNILIAKIPFGFRNPTTSYRTNALMCTLFCHTCITLCARNFLQCLEVYTYKFHFQFLFSLSFINKITAKSHLKYPTVFRQNKYIIYKR